MMKIKICGLFREQDIAYANEAIPDYAGFVFAPSKRQVSPAQAAALRRRLADDIIPVGVFVNAPITEIVALYNDNVIAIAQLHGDEDEAYMAQLKEKGIPIIKTIKISRRHGDTEEGAIFSNCSQPANQRFDVPLCLCERSLEDKYSDYYLIDSGAGSGKPFNWHILNEYQFPKPWFLAGGINLDNIKQAMALAPFAVDVSSGAETEGVKDREKMLQLVRMVHSEGGQ